MYWFQAGKKGKYKKTVIKDAEGNYLRAGKGTSGNASAVAVADWDDDGDLDLIIGNYHGEIHLAENVGSKKEPKFNQPQPLSAGDAPIKLSGDAGPFVADWDMDGKKDLLSGSSKGGVHFFRNTGTNKKPVLAPASLIVDQASSFKSRKPGDMGDRTKPCVTDWNEDGKPDLLVGDFSLVGRNCHGNVWLLLRKEVQKQTASAAP